MGFRDRPFCPRQLGRRPVEEPRGPARGRIRGQVEGLDAAQRPCVRGTTDRCEYLLFSSRNSGCEPADSLTSSVIGGFEAETHRAATSGSGAREVLVRFASNTKRDFMEGHRRG